MTENICCSVANVQLCERAAAAAERAAAAAAAEEKKKQQAAAEERKRQEEAAKRPLKEAMQAHGLTAEEQAQLIAEGVTTVEIFSKIPDDQFARSGIDIAARRKAAGAVLCVEGAGSAEHNGYYKENGAPASLPSVIANDDDDIMMISSCARSHGNK